MSQSDGPFAKPLTPVKAGKPGKPPKVQSEARMRRSLITPEGVDLNLTIADAGLRIGAFMIDLVIFLLVLLILNFVGWSVATAGDMKRSEFVAVVWVLAAFVLRNAWFIGFELSPRAATPGKRLMGIRVAARDGGRLTAEAVITRNALREVELWLPLGAMIATLVAPGGAESGLAILMLLWTGIFLLFPLFNRDRLRAGDLVAGTWVVKAPRRRLLPDLADHHSREAFAFTDAQLQAYGVKELHVLEQVLRARDRKTMAAVAARIKRKIDWQAFDGASDEAFLSAYYAGLRSRLEQRMLFGHRRTDKFDKA
jgi:uncharacterized RDD family membrane protein YckC